MEPSTLNNFLRFICKLLNFRSTLARLIDLMHEPAKDENHNSEKKTLAPHLNIKSD